MMHVHLPEIVFKLVQVFVPLVNIKFSSISLIYTCSFFLFRSGQLVSRQQFEATVNQGWVSWGFDLFFKRPISWSFGKMFGSSSNISGENIMLDMVKVEIINLFIFRNFASQVF